MIICSYQFVVAQENPVKKDSSKVYRKIEKYAKKRKFTQFVYKLVFEPVSKQKIKKNSFHKIKKQSYTDFEGKIIRKINITTLDPFGYSVTDTSAKPKTFLYKTGNYLHPKTHNLAISNLLLIKKNTPLDSLLVKESERLIRNQRYISSVAISAQLVAQDSVDVVIRVLDSWSLIPDFSTSNTKPNFFLSDKNFLGTGHEFSNSYTKSLTSSQDGFSSSYTVPSILNTFIKTTLSYKIDLDGNYTKFLNIERPFFSPYARWGTGLYLDQNFGVINTFDVNQTPIIQTFKYNSEDFWAGHSFRIFNMTVRYADQQFNNSPQMAQIRRIFADF